MNWSPIILSLELAAVTSIILLLISISLVYYLTQFHFKGKSIIESLINLPMILPPTVLGFYLLMLFSPRQGIGKWLNETFDIQLVFSFWGLVIGSVIYSLPFMLQPIQNGVEHLPNKLKESGYLLGYSKSDTFFKLLIPNVKPAIFTGFVLSFAHTIGEFGVVLMIGGNIPDETRVASVAIYEEVEALNYSGAHQYALILIGVSFLILFLLQITKRKNLIVS